jgi:hypothetical protein
MSQERHSAKYRPEHRSKRGNKTHRGKRGNAGSAFDHEHARVARLKRRDLRILLEAQKGQYGE